MAPKIFFHFILAHLTVHDGFFDFAICTAVRGDYEGDLAEARSLFGVCLDRESRDLSIDFLFMEFELSV